MNPVRFLVRAAGMTLVTLGGINHLKKKLSPRPSNLMAAAVHFRKGVEEFQTGLSKVLFGSGAELSKKPKESSRIPID